MEDLGRCAHPPTPHIDITVSDDIRVTISHRKGRLKTRAISAASTYTESFQSNKCQTLVHDCVTVQLLLTARVLINVIINGCRDAPIHLCASLVSHLGAPFELGTGDCSLNWPHTRRRLDRACLQAARAGSTACPRPRTYKCRGGLRGGPR